jgi:uncharacterized membrane protein
VNETGRVEAFSDGVFAIAITLLILDVKVPAKAGPGSLGSALIEEWPMFLAFLTSFFTIGVMWMNHHRLFNLIRAVDDALVALNLVLLLGITWIPFPTALLATHLRATGNDRTAAVVYSSTFFAMAIFFQILWQYATHTRGIIPPEKEEHAAHITKQYRWGPLFYIVAIALAIFSGTACLIWSLLLAIYFALPPRLVAKRT